MRAMRAQQRCPSQHQPALGLGLRPAPARSAAAGRHAAPLAAGGRRRAPAAAAALAGRGAARSGAARAPDAPARRALSGARSALRPPIGLPPLGRARPRPSVRAAAATGLMPLGCADGRGGGGGLGRDGSSNRRTALLRQRGGSGARPRVQRARRAGAAPAAVAAARGALAAAAARCTPCRARRAPSSAPARLYTTLPPQV
jgi:hypothetical protein